MRQVVARLTLAAVFVAAPSAARSQTSIDQLAQFSPGSTVQYLPFNVSVPGIFDMYTSGLNHIDPMLMLFMGAATDGTVIGVNDDGGPTQAGWNACGGVGGNCQSWLSMVLAPGDYTLAFGVFNLTEGEARSGSANVGPQDAPPGTTYNSPYCNAAGNWSSCNYTVSLRSQAGVATVTPEPASLTLLATGLLGVFGVVRRKRNSRLAA